ncbi:2-methylcitrate dehydratase [Chengkuizengella marina]|uniref:2-methylcitrate dehydratase n=1 Tax=Chengkuizengella marina TaxID=2507566 RepID=A0A6N9PZL5_9BACL|nr:2-methylcitrate dehydratase [Chengkuizengella marina]NBI28326.1 2-methylcitrate dehydratase [Chengkuizengella marina]
MSYINFKSVVKKVNIKPGGVKEIVLEVSDEGLKGYLDSLCEMVDLKVQVALESSVINYNITVDTSTEKPITNYEVDEKGFVSEVKEKGEQAELELGMPEEKKQTKEEKREADKKTIDEFIMCGLSPKDDDYDFESLVKRLHDGETYMKLANELDLNSGKIVEIIDEYRKSVAPLAQKWDEWRKSQGEINELTAENGKYQEKEEETEETETNNDDSEDGVA